MKKIALALALTVFGTVATQISANAQQQTTTPAADPKAPRFQFIGGDTHDFGSLKEGDPATYTFTFRNVGKRPLIITDVNASCGCTTPEWDAKLNPDGTKSMVVPPGQTGKIKVSYSTPGRVGAFDKAIWINSNGTPSPGQQRYQINIKGTVSPASQPAG